MTSRAVTVLVTSAGRRNYLVRWLREALESISPRCRVVVADANPDAPARAEASEFERLPSIQDETYFSTLLEISKKYEARLALSLNDYELSSWAGAEQLGDCSTAFVRLSARIQGIVEDKLQLGAHLEAHGVRYPPTVTAAAYLADRRLLNNASTVVIKARYGSGSSGLAIVDSERAEQAISSALPYAHDRRGNPLDSATSAAGALIVQPLIAGQEHGVDVVNDLTGRYQAVLARTKLAMRGGETDRAITAPPTPFASTGARLSRALGHRALIDTDIIVDENGDHWVIDINPRFGGGYPFNHIAGANVPLAIARWLVGQNPGDALDYRPGVRGAKYIEIAGLPRDD